MIDIIIIIHTLSIFFCHVSGIILYLYLRLLFCPRNCEYALLLAALFPPNISSSNFPCEHISTIGTYGGGVGVIGGGVGVIGGVIDGGVVSITVSYIFILLWYRYFDKLYKNERDTFHKYCEPHSNKKIYRIYKKYSRGEHH
jgi:hypothetical protein